MRSISYRGYRFPPDIMRHGIWLYLRFALSFRDVEDLPAERGIVVSYETIRRWVAHFGPLIAADLRRRRCRPHAVWHLDEMWCRSPASRSDGAAFRALGVSAQHIQDKRKNNRAESSDVPTRRRERRTQGFRSPGAAQGFLSTHAAAYNTFNLCRHLVSAKTRRRLRSEAIIVWRCAAGVTA
jgi:putative transposase